MIVTNYSAARANLASLMDKAVEDAEAIRIMRRGKPDIVLLSADEFERLQETAYLLRSPANAAQLLAAIEDALAGRGGIAVSPEDRAVIQREIEVLGDRPGGTSPTLERLIRESETDREADVAG